MKVVAINRKTGSKYVLVRMFAHAPKILQVATEAGLKTPWLVDARDVEMAKERKKTP